MAYESINVHAGILDCFRTTAETSYADKIYSQRALFTRWYCPAIKWLGNERNELHINNPNAGGETVTVHESELVKLTPGQ